MTPSANFASLVKQAKESGWDFFEGQGGERAAAERGLVNTNPIAAAAARLAENQDFVWVMEFMADQTLRRVQFINGGYGFDPMQVALYGTFREGQNSAVFLLFKLIAEGREEQLKDRGA
jgi:hypothetical protein